METTDSGILEHMPIRSKLREYLNERAYDERRKPYTVREVAKGAEVSASVVQGLMLNNGKPINSRTIERICKFLNCTITDWLVYEPKDTTP